MEFPGVHPSKYSLCTVFMSPETAISPHWRALFTADHVKKQLALVAIDEAHCIVDWLVLRIMGNTAKWQLLSAIGVMLLGQPTVN